MRFRPRRWGRNGENTARLVVPGLALLAIWLCSRLLHAMWQIFQNAYVDSYLYLPGSQVNKVYWSSVHFAFVGTVVVTALGGALVVLLVVELARLRR